ncbi:MAG: hypothetical protein ABJA98_12790 [Acidobacteriota bacterium]
MNALARAGATARLAELQQEIAILQAAFPELNRTSPPPHRGRARKQTAAEVTLPRKRKGMSAAAKKAVGERMKAYWAKRKGVASAPATQPATASAAEKPAAKPAAKRTLSPEGRAKISAAAKKRWRALRKAKKAA